MEIGSKLKRLRIKNNLTQEELADRCELSKGFISQIERDLASPSISTLFDILQCMGTDLKEFFNDETDEEIVFREEDIFVKENNDDKNNGAYNHRAFAERHIICGYTARGRRIRLCSVGKYFGFCRQ